MSRFMDHAETVELLSSCSLSMSTLPVSSTTVSWGADRADRGVPSGVRCRGDPPKGPDSPRRLSSSQWRRVSEGFRLSFLKYLEASHA